MTGVPSSRLGDVVVTYHLGSLLDAPREALYVAVNARGVMATGPAGAVRLAGGAEVERELRAGGELLVGSARLIGPARLAGRGVSVIACGVTTPAPGVPPKRAHVEDALTMGLDLLGSHGARSLGIPEVGSWIPGIELDEAAAILAERLAARIRRGSRFEQVTIVSLHDEYLRHCRDALARLGAAPL